MASGPSDAVPKSAESERMDHKTVSLIFNRARSICGDFSQIPEIFDVLRARGVCNIDDEERVKNEVTTRNKCRLLLRLLSYKGPRGYTVFLEALYEEKIHHIGSQMEQIAAEVLKDKFHVNITTSLGRTFEYCPGEDIELPDIKKLLTDSEDAMIEGLEQLSDKDWIDSLVSAFPHCDVNPRNRSFPLKIKEGPGEHSMKLSEEEQQWAATEEGHSPDTNVMSVTPAGSKGYEAICAWNQSQVADWLYSIGRDESVITCFDAHKICGNALLELNSDDFKEMGLVVGDRKVIVKALAQLCVDKHEAQPGADNKPGEPPPETCQREDDRHSVSSESEVMITDQQEQMPRQFKSKPAMKYYYARVLQTDQTDSFDNPVHYFHGTCIDQKLNLKEAVLTFVKFVAACLNDRRDGVFHIGVADGSSGQLKSGQIVGTYLVKEKDEYKEFFHKAITTCFYEDQVELVLACVSHIHFVEVTGHPGEGNRSYILEIDIEASYKLCTEEAFFVRLPKTDTQGISLYLLDGNEPNIADGKRVSDFMKQKSQFAQRRNDLEEERRKRRRGPMPDLRHKFLSLFGNGEASLSGDMYPILVINKPDPKQSPDCYPDMFSFIPDMDWKVVFDFDSTASLCQYAQNEMGMKIVMGSAFDKNAQENVINCDNLRQLHEDIKSSTHPYWVFMNGHTPTKQRSHKLVQWKKYYKQAMKETVRFFVNEIPRGRAMVVFSLMSGENDILLEAAEEMITAFPDQWMVVCDQEDIGRPWMEELARRGTIETVDERLVLGIPWSHLTEVVRELKGYRKTDACYIVTSSGAMAKLDNKKRHSWVDLEVLSMCECENTEIGQDPEKLEKLQREMEENFYKGSEVEWWNFYFDTHHVCKRDVHDDLKRRVNSALSAQNWDERVGRVVLYHQPGAGGTTTAKQILWSFHKQYRCAVIKSITEDTASQVIELFLFAETPSSSPKPVLLLLDNPEDEKASLLFAELVETTKHIIRERTTEGIVCALLVCLRKTQMPQKVYASKVHLRHDLSGKEINWFKNKDKELYQTYEKDGLTNPRLLISFNVLKANFDKQSLQKMVKETLKDICDEERRLLKYVSLMNTFDIQGRALPTAAFDMLMVDLPYAPGPRHGRKACGNRWEAKLSSQLRLLVNECTRPAMGYIHALKIAHPVLSRIVMKELCYSKTTNELLSDVFEEFLECKKIFCNGSNARDNLLKIVLDLLKQRQKRVDGTPDTRFSPLIQEIVDKESPERAGIILKKGLSLSNDPFVAQQLARLYISVHEWLKAEHYAEQATELRPDSSFLWDTYGRIYEKQLTEAYTKLVSESKPTNAHDLISHLVLATKGLRLFRKVQSVSELERTTSSNSAGYEGELRMVSCLLHCLSFAEPFYGNMKKFQSFLVGEGDVPHSIVRLYDVDGINYIDIIKSLHSGTRKVLTHVDDEMIQLRAEILDDMKGSLERRYSQSIDKLKGELAFYFGETQEHIPDNLTEQESCDFRRRRIFSLVGTSMRGIFERKRAVGGERDIEQVREYARLNMESTFACADDIQTLICANLSLLSGEGYLSQVKYSDMVAWSKSLYEKRSSRSGVYLEPYLFYVMFNWPRVSVPSFIRRIELEDAIFKWKDAYIKKYPRQRDEGKPYKKKDTTMFFLANGSGMNSICSHEQLMASQDQKIRNDAFWRSPCVLKLLQRFSGTLNSDGTLVSVDLVYPSKSKEQVSIPTSFPIRDRSRWNKRVFLVLGFTWVGPKAFDVTLKDPTEDVDFMVYDDKPSVPKHLRQFGSSSRKMHGSSHENLTKLREIQIELSTIDGLKVRRVKGEQLSSAEHQLMKKESYLQRQKQQLIDMRMRESDDDYRD